MHLPILGDFPLHSITAGRIRISEVSSSVVSGAFGPMRASGVPRSFVRGWVQQIQLRTEDRENGDLGAAAP